MSKQPLKGFTNEWVKHITVEKLAAQLEISPVPDRIAVSDPITTGLILCVTKKGKKTWTYKYVHPFTKKQVKEKLGTFPTQSVDDAREKVKTTRKQVEDRVDPKAAKKATADASKPGMTIKELITLRLAKKVTGKQRRADEVKWRYEKYIIPKIGDVAVKDFDPSIHHASVIDPLWDAGKECMAGALHRDLFALFRFATNKVTGVKYNLMAGVENPFKYTPCNRWLTDEEIVTLWRNLPEALEKSAMVQRIIKLLLATGQRSNEVCQMQRDQIDLQNRLWTIPKEVCKNGHEHIIPLNDIAMSLIGEAMRETNGDFLFPREEKDAPRTSNDISTAVNYAAKVPTHRKHGLFGIEYWTPHDLRRTVSNHMSRLGVLDAHISLVLNHRTYTHATVTQSVYKDNPHIPEKRAAVDLWGDHLQKLVGDIKPVRLAGYGVRRAA